MRGFFSFMQIGPVLTMVMIAARFLAGLVIAVAIYRNASSRSEREYGIPPLAWSALALGEPALGLLAYWFVHREQR